MPGRLALGEGRNISMQSPGDGLQRPFVHIHRDVDPVSGGSAFAPTLADDFAFLAARSGRLWKELSDLFDEVKRQKVELPHDQRVRIEGLLYDLRSR